MEGDIVQMGAYIGAGLAQCLSVSHSQKLWGFSHSSWRCC